MNPSTPATKNAIPELLGGPGNSHSGLICGYLMRHAELGRAIECDEAARWLSARADPAATDPAAADHRSTDDGYVWLHFNLAHTAAVPWLKAHAGLSPDFYEALDDASRTTRIERSEQSLLAVINDVHFDFAFEPSEIATLWMSVERHLVVTARRQPLRSIDKLRESVRTGYPLASSVELLEYLLHLQAEVLADVVHGVTEKIDTIEDQLLANRPVNQRAQLGALRRLLVRLQRLLAPEPASLFRLLLHPPSWIAPADAEELRRSSEEFSLVLRDMGTLQERIKLLQDEIAAAVNEGNNRSLYVLTVVTVLALPINLVAGLFGMNVGGIPLAQNEHGFWIVLTAVFSFTAVVGWLAFRHRQGGNG